MDTTGPFKGWWSMTLFNRCIEVRDKYGHKGFTEEGFTFLNFLESLKRNRLTDYEIERLRDIEENINYNLSVHGIKRESSNAVKNEIDHGDGWSSGRV